MYLFSILQCHDFFHCNFICIVRDNSFVCIFVYLFMCIYEYYSISTISFVVLCECAFALAKRKRKKLLSQEHYNIFYGYTIASPVLSLLRLMSLACSSPPSRSLSISLSLYHSFIHSLSFIRIY